MGFGDLGANNPASKIPTPHLDKLAIKGMHFTTAHSLSGICILSRYGLLTGRFHWRKFHCIVNAFDKPALDEVALTLLELLKTKGYRTACIGKVFAPDAFDWSKPISSGPLSHGFDYYFGDDVPNFSPYVWMENGRVITMPPEPLTIAPKTKEGNWEARSLPASTASRGKDFCSVTDEHPRLGHHEVLQPRVQSSVFHTSQGNWHRRGKWGWTCRGVVGK
jgi:arylsulfatase A